MHASPRGPRRTISLHGGRPVRGTRVVPLLSGLWCSPVMKRCVVRKSKSGAGVDGIAVSGASSATPVRCGTRPGSREVSGHDDQAHRRRES